MAAPVLQGPAPAPPHEATASARASPPAAPAARAWLQALRLRTLGASVVPVLVGLALALDRGAFQPLVAAATLASAVLIQVGVNLANDYYDHVKGVDRPDRMGPARAAGKLLPAGQVQAAMGLALAAAAVPGAYLVLVGGWPVLAVGLAALASAVLYAGGPRPLGHLGLGDLFVFVFFGPVAVGFTYFLQAGALPPEALLAGVPPGALSAAILIVNNVRDIPTDARAGKRTMAVRLGPRGSWVEYLLLLVASYATPVVLVLGFGLGPWTLLPLLSLPLALAVWHACRTHPGGPGLNPLLVRTAGVHALVGLLLAGGLAL